MMKQVTSNKFYIPVLRITAAIVSGLMLAFSICKPGVWQMSWLALVPLIIATEGQSPRTCAGLWFTAGLVYYGILLSWIKIFGYEPWILLVLVQAVYYCLFGLVLGFINRRHNLLAGAVGGAALWAVLQWMRGLGMIGFTWGSFAHIQAASPTAMLPAVWSPLILEYLVFEVNAIVAMLLIHFVFRRKPAISGKRGTAIAASICLACLLFFYISAIHIQKHTDTKKPFSAAILQGNEPQDVEVTDEYLENVYSLYEYMSLSIKSQTPRLIVWPETTIPADFTGTGYEFRTRLLAKRTDSCYLVGAYSPSENANDTRKRNSAYIIDRDGTTKGIYSKVRLVPFGEFVPFRKNLNPLLKKFPVRSDDVLPGNTRPVIGTSIGKIGTLICFESLFTEFARQEVRDGAQVLVVITNDSWFGRTQAAYQHLLFSKLRAVETGRPVVRAAATGISALIMPDGRVQDAVGIFRQQILQGTLYAQTNITPSVALGNIPLYLFVALCAVALIWKPRTTGK